jgi:ankyrin repeat protein
MMTSRACLLGILIAVGLVIATPADAQTDSGLTALLVASGDGHTEVVSQLLASGADPNIQTKCFLAERN